MTYIQRAETTMGDAQSLVSTCNYSAASDLFEKAGTLFKLAMEKDRSGEAYDMAGNTNLRSGSEHSAASNFLKAGAMYEKVDVQKAKYAYRNAIRYFMEVDRLPMCIKVHIKLATMHITAKDTLLAISEYKAAASLAEMESLVGRQIDCYGKVGELLARRGDCNEASMYYGKSIRLRVGNKLMEYGTHRIIFMALLCTLSSDGVDAARSALYEYADLLTNFAETRECSLITLLCDSVEGGVGMLELKAHAKNSIVYIDTWIYNLIEDIDTC